MVEKVLVADSQMAGADDATLIERSRGGEPAAFGELVTRYQDRLFNTLVRVCGETEEARVLNSRSQDIATRQLTTTQQAHSSDTDL